jgi:hypothetical protein
VKKQSRNQQQIAGFADNLLVSPATFLQFSTGTGTSLENLMAKPKPVSEQKLLVCCWLLVASYWFRSTPKKWIPLVIVATQM